MKLSSAENTFIYDIHFIKKVFFPFIIGNLSFGCKKNPENYLDDLGQENIQEKYFVVATAVGGKLKTEYVPSQFYDYSKQVKHER